MCSSGVINTIGGGFLTAAASGGLNPGSVAQTLTGNAYLEKNKGDNVFRTLQGISDPLQSLSAKEGFGTKAADELKRLERRIRGDEDSPVLQSTATPSQQQATPDQIQYALARQRRRNAGQQGQASTIFTSPLGVSGTTTTSRRSLLGA